MPQIKINGAAHNIDADPQMPMLWAIRDIVGLTGTKFGCGVGACGACTVHMDGQAVRSCLTTLADVQGHEIVTIEGLSTDGTHPVQLAWEANNVPSGYCQAGQIMQAAALLRRIEQSNYTDYLVPRIDITPETHVYFVENTHPPGGVGEPGVPPTAPAICNAIYAATGKRIRVLPVDPQLLKA